jgi:molybdopterin-guanine dinucleotide biosynthesis protein A
VTPAAGLLLTGGSSRRLGVDKAILELDGESLASRLARVLGAVCSPTIEVGPGYTTLPATREDPPGQGPLAALTAGAAAIAADRALMPTIVLAVDLPFVDTALVEWLVAHPAPITVVPIVDGVRQTLCARYSPDALAAARELLDAGERSLRALLAAVPVHEAPEAEWAAVASQRTFADVDTREDAAEFGLSTPG